MMAELPMIAPRSLSDAMQAVVDTHQRIKASIQQHAEDEQARRDAADQRMTAEQGLGYRATT